MWRACAADARPAGAARSRCRKAISPSTRSSPRSTTSRPRAPRRSATSACAACRKGAASPARRTIQGDLVIDVPQDTVINAQVVRKAATDRVIERNAAVQLCYVEVDEPDMHKPLGDLDRLKAVLEKDWGWKDLLVAAAPHPASPEDPAQGRTGASPRRSIATWNSSRPFIIGALSRPEERSLRHCLRHRLDDDRHASGVAAVRAASSPRPARRTRRSASAKT